MRNQLKICGRCVLPETFPGIHFDENNICNFCNEFPSVEQAEINRLKLKKQIEEIIQQNRGKNEYDCIVAFSGGKDSSYILTLFVREYKLKCLAVTVDNGFISEQALANCNIVTSALGVDHILFKPSTTFINNVYVQSVTQKDIHSKAAIKRASSMCNSCINLINNYMLKLALQHRTTLIAGGYISGQVPKNSALIRLDLNMQKQLRDISLKKYIMHFGDDAKKYYSFDSDLSKNDAIYILNPMLAEAITEEEIIKNISTLGWQMTTDTGKNSSNCKLNDLGIAIHYKQHQFNPYVFEISEQVRQGLMDRETALKKTSSIPEFKDLKWQMQKLGFDFSEI